MSCKFNLFGKSFVALGAFMVVCAAYAAGRDGGDVQRGMQMGTLGAGAATGSVRSDANVRVNDMGAVGGSNIQTQRHEGRDVRNVTVFNAGTARMPAMPQLPINSVGNLSHNFAPKPVVPSVPNVPDTPVVPDKPDVPDEPTVSGCPDGGVENSEYTINICMNDIRACVNSGGLPNGINDLYNADMMSSVINGVGVCVDQIEKCVREVRRDCKNVYNSNSDVWIDFESRVVQPEYYNFVLRKTGLTPYQAQMTCEMLDTVAHGSSFLVSDADQNVAGAAGVGALGGLKSESVDGGREHHYARWDAVTADCLVRVAAYNKDKLITNTWLFGGAGDDTPAEVWLPAGEMFTCGKDLFGFALKNQTKTAAVLAPTAGALVGGAIGAGAATAPVFSKIDCSDARVREKMTSALKGKEDVLKNFMSLNKSNGVYDSATCDAILSLAEFPKDIEVSQTKYTRVDVANSEGLSGYSYKKQEDKKEVIIDLGFLYTALEDIAGRKSDIAKGAGIGAGAGAGVGGLVTAITALVEGDNITCRVGDGLQSVGLNKADKIHTLKEFYVKWGLNLPDAITPTAMVTDCLSWQAACAGITDYSQCKAAQINYQPDGAPNIIQVRTACTVSGNACIHNPPVAKSYGACE